MKLRKLLVVMLTIVGATTVMAQPMQLPPIPVDPAVRIGKLDNGLTYYIRHNGYPEHVANFYIAQRVGAIQEEESQRGLAHFLEHMAFNGSEHFKGNGIIEFTRSLGVEFGSDLNAYTSIDQTVYRVCNVPTKRATALDSCLLILKDWSNGLSLEADEIDKERDVVHNEWRLGEGPTQRMIQRALPKMYPDSKYGVRLPIGLMSVIDSFKPQTLKAYYQKWYRPDNQAIIVVGDVDVDHMEAKIKELFGGIKVPANAPKVVAEAVPDNKEAIYIFEKDKEMRMNYIFMCMKHDATPEAEKSSMAYLIQDYAVSVISKMFDQRLSEMTQEASCPFLQASAEDGQYWLSKTKDCFELFAAPKEGKDMEALQVLYREAKRVREFGFTATEYERAKADYLSGLEKRYTNRDKRKNDEFGNAYRDHYLTNEPIPPLDVLYQTMQQIAPNIPVQAINQMLPELISVTDSNLVVMIMAQEKEGKVYPTEQDMAAAIAAARAEKLEAYVDNVKQEPLLDVATIKKGKIKKETENTQFGYKELKLSNGATVILKKTDFKDDEVLIQGEAKGGMTLFGKEDDINLQLVETAIAYSGLGNFQKSELDKALAGKQAGVSTKVAEDRQYISGRSVPKDLETLFQLVYLTQTNICKDVKSMASFVNQMQTILANKSLNHQLVYNDSVESVRHNHNPLFMVPELEDVKKFDYDRTLAIAKQLYENGGQFTYTLVGNFDEQKAREYIEQYIASLPAGTAVKADKDMRSFFSGNKVCKFEKKMETPQATTCQIWLTDKLPYTLENKVLLSAASQVLTRIYLRTIREEESAAYNVSASGEISTNGPTTVFMLSAAAPTNPDKQQIARDLMLKYLTEATQKVADDDLNPVKEILLKQAQDKARENGHWLDVLTEWTAEGVDLQTDYAKTVNALTPAKVQKFLSDIVAAGNHAEIIMMPEK